MSNSKNSRKRSKKGASKPNIRLILGIVAVSFVIVSALCVSAVTGINRWLNSQDTLDPSHGRRSPGGPAPLVRHPGRLDRGRLAQHGPDLAAPGR